MFLCKCKLALFKLTIRLQNLHIILIVMDHVAYF